jgi:8-oxo-dGTP diphosphatase
MGHVFSMGLGRTYKNGALPKILFAAGGVVWDRRGSECKVAVVHRPKCNDWSLPKGKPARDEKSLAETARREIREEVGCKVKFINFAGTKFYSKGGKTKVILFWNMRRVKAAKFRPNGEVDEVLWLSPRSAIKKLRCAMERRLVSCNWGRS